MDSPLENVCLERIHHLRNKNKIKIQPHQSSEHEEIIKNIAVATAVI